MENIQFKFKWLNEKGQPCGMMSKQGGFDGETLVLDTVRVPAAALLHVDNRDQRMIMSAATTSGQPAPLLFAITKGSAPQLKQALAVARSTSWAQAHKKELEAKGLVHLYREERCPRCGATLVLTHMDRSPQLYCHFCDALTTMEDRDQAPPDEHEYRLCDVCGMFSKPRRFTVFYFYFLLAVYGWYSKTTWRCPACMRPEAWKMFFGNFPFLLGLPPAIVQLVRAYGSASLGRPFAGLDSANLRARKGDMRGAIERYRPILERLPYAAGVKHNIGQALMREGDIARAADAFRMALADCSNYAPAYRGLVRCYQELNEAEKLAALQREWRTDEPAAKEPAADTGMR